MIPSPTERDELFKRFARALFKGDMDALYQVVTPDFLWSFHDGLAVTKSLQGPAAIAAHLAEQKALFSTQHFHDIAYHHAGDISFMTFRVSETVRATGEQREQPSHSDFGELQQWHVMTDHHSPVDGARVLADLHALRAIGAYKTGVHKPTFSEPHIRSLQWLAQRPPEAGLTAKIDGNGNVFGSSARPGPKLLAGSHLESQNYAGWLDGPLGVVYALEAARVINSDPNASGAVEVAAWCDEEGHFGSFLGSRSYVGGVTEPEIDAARDRSSGKTMRDALQEAGLAGRARVACERGRHIGYLEAHIEQGQTLEGSALKIGVVTSIVGIWQYRITFTGEQNHAGTTRMAVRRDAGLALARFCVDIDDRFPAHCGPRTVWTTGRITLDPGAPSVIPGAAEMLFQIRDADADVIARLEDLLRSMAADVSAQGRSTVAVERIRTGAPALMDASFQNAVEAASAACAGGKSIRMPSGAGHNAQVLATAMPAGMLFVPSIGGISHHWTENTCHADIVTGAEVFVDACRRLLKG